jgi:transposase-like protein
MGREANPSLALAWKRRLGRQSRSGLSIAESCSQEGISPASFYSWRRRLRRADAAVFVPVELPASGFAAGVRIELPGGAVLSLPADAPLELVTAAIRAAMPNAAAEPSTC